MKRDEGTVMPQLCREAQLERERAGSRPFDRVYMFCPVLSVTK